MLNTEINMIYKYNKSDKTKWIFGFNFVHNNKDKCKIIYEGKYHLN